MGSLFEHLLTAEESGGGLGAALVTQPSGIATPLHRHTRESEAFFLRVAGPGDYRYKGGDLGILVSRGRFQADDGSLTERCRRWVDGIKRRYEGVAAAAGTAEVPHGAVAVKGG